MFIYFKFVLINMFSSLREIIKIFNIIILFLAFLLSPQLYASAAGNSIAELENLLDTRISSASRYEQTISEAPASISIISAEEIERYGYREFNEVLNSIRGLSTRTDRNYNYLSFRGVDLPYDYGNKILLLINGHPLNENYYGAAVWGNDLGFDLSIIERIEILRGPGSAIYGTGAMLGVINIILKKGNDIDGVAAGIETGSFGRFGATLTAGDSYDSGLDYIVSFNYKDIEGEDLYFKEYDSPETNNGDCLNNDNDKIINITGRAEYGDFKIIGSYAARTKSVPTASYSTIFNDPSAKTIDNRGFIEFAYEKRFDESISLEINTFYDYYYYKGDYPYYEDDMKSSYIWYDKNVSYWYGAEARCIWDIASSSRFVGGIEFRDNYKASYLSSDEYVDFYFNENHPFQIFTVYLEDQYQIFENFGISLGLRYDGYFGGIEESVFAPRFAIIYNPFRTTTIKLLFNKAFRVQNLYEVYYESIDEAIGNKGLMPENNLAHEFVIEQQINNNISFIASIYNFRMKDIINQVKTEYKYDGDDEPVIVNQFKNLNELKTIGFEVSANAKFNANLQSYLNYSYQSASYILQTGNSHLENSPLHLLKGGISYLIFESLSASAEFIYETGRKTLENDEYKQYKTNPFLLTNIGLSFLPNMKKDEPFSDIFNRVKSSLRVNNLFDIDYKLPASYDLFPVQAVKQYGRSIIFDIMVKI